MGWRKENVEKELVTKALRRYSDFLIATVADEKADFTVIGRRNRLSLAANLLTLIDEIEG